MVTQSIIIALPLAALAFFPALRWRIVALGLSMPFGDAAVVNLGGTSVLIPWFIVLVFIGRFIADFAFRTLNGRDLVAVTVRCMPIIALIVYNIFLVSYSVYLFTDIAETMPGSAAFKIKNAVPLAQQPESLNQLVYLVLCLIYVIVLAVTLLKDKENFDHYILRFVYAAFFCACLWYYWHFASNTFGIPFPGALLHSDLTTSGWEQALGGVYRPSGSFSEPSAASAFFIPMQFFFFEMYLARGRRLDMACWFAAMGGLFLSTSTTGYVGMAIFFSWMIVRVLMGGAVMSMGIKISTKKLNEAFGLAIMGAGLAVVVGVFFINWNVVLAIYDAQIANKTQSISFEERSYANMLALEILQKSYGMGIGLGNHRASSLVLALLSGVGFVGFILFFYMIGESALRCLGASRGEPSVRVGFNWAVATVLGAQVLGMLIASGELQSLPLWTWVAFAIVVSLARRRAGRPMTAAPPDYMPAPPPHQDYPNVPPPNVPPRF